jgi:hypothetical protein
MSRSRGAAVIFKKVRLGKEGKKELSPIKWKEIEEILGKSLSDEVRGE